MDQVIVVNHVQQFKKDHVASRFQLGLYKYYNDKSLRHVLQHYVDVAEDRYGDEWIEDIHYDEEHMKFCITYKQNKGLAERTYIMADVYPLNCVTALPLAPFEPRSPEEAESNFEFGRNWSGKFGILTSTSISSNDQRE